jgi:paraquat-inducible protein B
MKAEKSSWLGSWYVWLFPLFALVISGWLVYKYFEDRGPVIRIAFDDAAAIQADKTFVRFRGVNIGKVTKIEISKDNEDVLAWVQLRKHAKNFAVKGSKYWIVSPKVNMQEVTGLETFFGGAYIAAQPGPPDGEITEDFTSLTNADNSEDFENTTAYFLETPNAEAVSEGDKVTFRGLQIGLVRRASLMKGSQLVKVQIQIQNRYVHLIRENTVFSHKVAVHAKLGLFNSELKINSFDSILHGGIEVFTPPPAGPKAKGLAHFKLYRLPPKDYQLWNPELE